MPKFFNTTGPCLSEKHYMLPTQHRCVDLSQLVEDEQYFVIHAARQTGKTTLLRDFVKELNDKGKYYALYCSLETVQGIMEPSEGVPAIARTLSTIIGLNPIFKPFPFGKQLDFNDYNNLIFKSLSTFCSQLDKPFVVMFDEVDCLSNGTLISFLRQLRNGYVERGSVPFIHSLALTGMRNIRDYKGRIRENAGTLGSASPFNIVKKSLTLRNFTLEEVKALYGQHSAGTGQVFTDAVAKHIFGQTCGQPWLVNAIAAEIVEEILNKDFGRQVTLAHADEAAERIIRRRDTHIDSLLERLKEERVRRIVEPVILGRRLELDPLDDDFQYVMDLGLLKQEHGDICPSNPLYAEVIIRTLSYRSQFHMPMEYEGRFIQNGIIDMTALFRDFQQFWRENSAIWVEKYQYKEAAPHLILQAYLQRIINAGGRISREFSAARGRIDICIDLGGRRYPVELKLRYSAKTKAEGVKQLCGYLDSLGEEEGWLVIFDRRAKVAWSRKLFQEDKKEDGKLIHVVGC